MFNLPNPNDTVLVLMPGGYSDSPEDYERIQWDDIGSVDHLMYVSGSASAVVYHGERTPWDEHDAYPDIALLDATEWEHLNHDDREGWTHLEGTHLMYMFA